jgi:hypothetical protein
MNRTTIGFCTGLTLLAALGIAPAAIAASSFSNSLTGFSGNSTQAATQAAVGAAGFNFFSTSGLATDFTSDPTVVFDGNGANFGTLFTGDGGRNYVRTNQSDYATVSFVAEITFVTTNLDAQDTFIGLGSGDTALFGWPDWSTQFSSVILTPEINVNPLLTTMYTTNDNPIFVNNPAPGMDSGTHRLRLSFDATAKTAVFSIDLNYAGGPYTPDITAAPVDVATLYSPPKLFDAGSYTVWRDTLGSTTDLRANWDNTGASMGVIDQADYDYWKLHFGEVQSAGWPTDPSRIYFGGDDGVIFKDFSVTVSAGAGSGLAGGAAPEPSSILLFAMGLVGATGFCRRWNNAW